MIVLDKEFEANHKLWFSKLKESGQWFKAAINDDRYNSHYVLTFSLEVNPLHTKLFVVSNINFNSHQAFYDSIECLNLFRTGGSNFGRSRSFCFAVSDLSKAEEIFDVISNRFKDFLNNQLFL